jgi:hypothetical protein
VSEHAHEATNRGADTAAGRPQAGAGAPAPTALLRLQGTIGNRAVARMLQRQQAASATGFDAADVEALTAYGEVFKLRQELSAGGGPEGAARLADAKRTAIVKLAVSQVGKVLDEPGPDGNKKGWERLREFYRVACPSYTPQYDKGIKGVGMWAGQKALGESREGLPWSWCAIFGVWAIHQITGIGWFAGKPIGLGELHTFTGKPEDDAAAVKPGDMIARREVWQIEGREKRSDEKALYHHALVASVDTSNPAKPEVTTVNGNGFKQGISLRTEPVRNYLGYYDSLSETDWGKYEQQIRKKYGWAVEAREKAGLAGVSQ